MMSQILFFSQVLCNNSKTLALYELKNIRPFEFNTPNSVLSKI